MCGSYRVRRVSAVEVGAAIGAVASTNERIGTAFTDERVVDASVEGRELNQSDRDLIEA
jgi:hypothetical protein